MASTSGAGALESIEDELRLITRRLGADSVEPRIDGDRFQRKVAAYVQASRLVHIAWAQLNRSTARAVFREGIMDASTGVVAAGHGLPSRLRAARDEVLRLIHGLDSVTADIQSVKGLLSASERGKARLLDTALAAEQRTILANERAQVERLEAVLAVIGTVKAGKSTIINAIIGMDLLPNRKLPMTTYPTFIRHDETLDEPRLTVPMAGDFTSLIAELKPLIAARAQSAGVGQRILVDDALEQLAKAILSGGLNGVQPRYDGRAAVIGALEVINDLTRLAAAFEREAPVPAQTAGLSALPSISVRFSHLKQLATGEGGRIALLDTPGPNEAGIGEALRRIVRESIQQTSATVLVADFTQLRVEAGNEVQDILRASLFDVLDRVYVFVNKFDERRASDWSYDQTRAEVSRITLDGKIPPSRIFPVSGLGGFLANAAHRMLEREERLPEAAWVEDFIRRFGGVGIRGRQLLVDSDAAKEAAREGWKESGLDEPLTHVISHAARYAASICLDGALRKIAGHGKVTDSFLVIRETASTMDAETLRGEINRLSSEIEEVEQAKGGVLKSVDASFEGARKDLVDAAGDVQTELEEVLKAFLASGHIKVHPSVLEKAEKEVIRRRKGKQAEEIELERKLQNVNEVIKLDPSREDRRLIRALEELAQDTQTNTILLQNQYATQAEAMAQLERVRNQVTSIITRAEDELGRRLSERIDTLGGSIVAYVKRDLSRVLASAEERLKTRFDVSVDFPELELGAADIERYAAEIEGALGTKSVKDYYLKVRDTLTAKVKRGVGKLLGGLFDSAPQWGYDKVEFTKDVYVIDLEAIKSQTWKTFGSFQHDFEVRIDHYVKVPVHAAVNGYFASLGAYLDGFRNDLGDALRDKSLEESELKKLCEDIARLKIRARDILEDALAAGDGVATLTGQSS